MPKRSVCTVPSTARKYLKRVSIEQKGAREKLTPKAKEKPTSSKERKGKGRGKRKRRLIIEESPEHKLAKPTEKPPGKMREVGAER